VGLEDSAHPTGYMLRTGSGACRKAADTPGTDGKNGAVLCRKYNKRKPFGRDPVIANPQGPVGKVGKVWQTRLGASAVG
jgi:hypothetical protein